MQRRLWAFPLLILLASSMPPALADDDWEEDNKNGTTALEEAKYKDAEKFFLAAKKDSEKSGSKYGHYATSLLNLGLVYDKMDKVPDSEKAYKEALGIYEKSYGPDSAEDSRALHGLAETYRHHNKYTEALPLFQRALKIRDKLFPTHPDTAETSLRPGRRLPAPGQKYRGSPSLPAHCRYSQGSLWPHPSKGSQVS